MMGDTQRVLVLGRATAGSGVAKKLEDVCVGLQLLGIQEDHLRADPGRNGTRQFIHALLRSRHSIIYARADYALLLALPLLLLHRLRGTRLVVDVPSPWGVALREAHPDNGFGPRHMAQWMITVVHGPLVSIVASRLITYAPEPMSWFRCFMGPKAVQVGNGILVPKRPQRDASSNVGWPEELHLVGLGMLWSSRGADRLLCGLREFQRRPESADSVPRIRLVLTGPRGVDWDRLVDEVDALGLRSNVSIVDLVSGSELDQLMNWADIGVGSLANHRKGLSEASPLKHREYLARGLPVLLAGHDTGIPSDSGVSIVVPESDDPVNFETVIQQFEVLTEIPGLSQRCRRFALEHLDVRTALIPHILSTATGADAR